MSKLYCEKDIKTFLGEWEMLDNNKMRRIIDPIRLKWFRNQIKQAEIRGYQNCLKKQIQKIKGRGKNKIN